MTERFSLHGTAAAATGHFTHIRNAEVEAVFPRLAEAALGRKEQADSEGGSVGEAFSVGSSYARAILLNADSPAEQSMSLVEVEVRDLNIDGRLRIERLAAMIRAISSPETDEPAFAVQAVLAGVTLDGRPIRIYFADALVGIAMRMSELRERYARDRRFALEYKRLLLKPGLVTSSWGGEGPNVLPEAQGHVAATLVKHIECDHPDAMANGNILTVRNFGRIHFGEMMISAVSRSVALIQVKLGSPVKGVARLGLVDSKAIPTAGESIAGSSKAKAVVELFFATDRPVVREDGGTIEFGAKREGAGKITLGTCTVSIPREHRVAKLEARSIVRLRFLGIGSKPDPGRYIEPLATWRLETPEFYDHLRSRTVGSRQAFVFVHGYNVSFEDAARRAAQLAYDLHFDGAPILYSWPAAGDTFGYGSDGAAVDWTYRHLAEFLKQLSRESDIDAIHLIAHSMGNRPLTNALERLVLLGLPNRFQEVVLAAADVDEGVFSQVADSVRSAAARVTIYASRFDRALFISELLHRGRRVGQLVVVDHIDTIDSSDVDNGLLRHSSFAESRSVLSDLFYVLDGQPVDRRFALEKLDTSEGLSYYVFQK